MRTSGECVVHLGLGGRSISMIDSHAHGANRLRICSLSFTMQDLT